MGESLGYVKINVFRRVGGEYFYSRILLFNRTMRWEAVTINTTNRSMLASHMVDTTPVVVKGDVDYFNDPDLLLNYLIEKLGFVLMFNDVEDRMIACL